MDKLVISDHKAISFEFIEDNKFKLDRIKEIIEPYNIAQIKIDDISNKLKDAFLNDITEIKIKRIIYDNKYEFKPKIRKIKYKTNGVEKIVSKIKELKIKRLWNKNAKYFFVI